MLFHCFPDFICLSALSYISLSFFKMIIFNCLSDNLQISISSELITGVLVFPLVLSCLPDSYDPCSLVLVSMHLKEQTLFQAL